MPVGIPDHLSHDCRGQVSESGESLRDVINREVVGTAVTTKRLVEDKRIAQAKAVCSTCPVMIDCRTHALHSREPYGIWGVLSEQERAEHLGLQSVRYPAPRTHCQRVRGTVEARSTVLGCSR
jgi:hypothetical protein